MYPEDSLQFVLDRQAAVRQRAHDVALISGSRHRRFGRRLRLVDAAQDPSMTHATFGPSSDGSSAA